jgi:GDP-L-fucose synthase
MNKRILITGGAGFVGRHFVEELLKIGHLIYCVDNIVPLTGGVLPEEWPLFSPRDYNNFKFYQQDCRDFFRENKCLYFDYVFHLAAMVGGREMIENNPLAVAQDLSIDSEFWSWVKNSKPNKVICFSSSAAYPVKYQKKDNYLLLTEDMIDFNSDIGMPDMSYGWAKLTHEYVGKLAFEKHGIKSVTYRPFSGYGEDQDLAYPFPSICRRVLKESGSKSITVWGTGDQMRDFIHIKDCVRGVLSTMDMIDNGGAINLSTGILTSFKNFAFQAANLCGYSPEVLGTSNTPEGVFARGGDTKKQSQLGFEYHISFEDGIKRALDHFEKSL